MKEPFISLCSEITRENAFTLMDWLGHKEVIRYLSDSHNISNHIEQVVNRVNLPVLTHLFNQNGRFYMAYDKHKTPVGFVRLAKSDSNYEIVVVIGDRDNWGKKLGAATIRESLKSAFFDLKAKKVIAKIHKENKRSIHAFTNSGFTFETETPHMKILSITLKQYLTLKKGGAVMPTEIYITEIDKKRLKNIIDAELKRARTPDSSIKSLEGELQKAKVVSPYQIPGDIITMNSRALLHLENEELEVSLVYPEDADWGSQKMSVLSPIGTAILGYGKGDVIDWEVPSGITKIHIKDILYQPEAAGDYHM